MEKTARKLKEQVVQELREAASSPTVAARPAGTRQVRFLRHLSPSYIPLGFSPSHLLPRIQCSNDEAIGAVAGCEW